MTQGGCLVMRRALATPTCYKAGTASVGRAYTPPPASRQLKEILWVPAALAQAFPSYSDDSAMAVL